MQSGYNTHTPIWVLHTSARDPDGWRAATQSRLPPLAPAPDGGGSDEAGSGSGSDETGSGSGSDSGDDYLGDPLQAAYAYMEAKMHGEEGIVGLEELALTRRASRLNRRRRLDRRGLRDQRAEGPVPPPAGCRGSEPSSSDEDSLREDLVAAP